MSDPNPFSPGPFDAKINWTLQKRLIKELKAHKKNPRRLTKDQAQHLAKSIDKFGLIDKPIINTDGTIIGGHQRINILKAAKEKEVECWVPDQPLQQEDIDELNIRLNKNTGEWDWDCLANEWEAPDLLEWGFTEEELLGPEAENVTQEIEDEEIGEAEHQKKCEVCGQKIKTTPLNSSDEYAT